MEDADINLDNFAEYLINTINKNRKAAGKKSLLKVSFEERKKAVDEYVAANPGDHLVYDDYDEDEEE